MSKSATRLQKAFLAKEEVEKLIVNLEELKSEGSVTDEQYGYLKKDYADRLTAADSAIAQQRVELKSRLDDSQASMANSKLELDRLSLRFKVGELPLDKYESLDRNVRRRVSRAEAEIAELGRLLEAKHSSDIGVVASASGRTAIGGRGFSLPETSSFTSFVDSISDVANPRIRLVSLVGGFFLFISIFMPWFSVGGFGFTVSYAAADVSGHLVAAGVLCGLLAMGAALLAESDTKGFVHIVVGGIALLVILIAMVAPNRELGTSIFGAIGQGWITGREGIVFYMIAAIAVICGGVFERREA